MPDEVIVTSGMGSQQQGANRERKWLEISGARVHNLQDIDISIPRGELVVVSGVSGSGKSSLVFDTILAEGQRQYVQSLSVFSRQYFSHLERPDVERITGLQPTVAIDQFPAAQNRRSTVATLTDIYDYLRLLMARVGEGHCHECGTPISHQSPAEIEGMLGKLPPDTRLIVMAPLVRGRKGKHADIFRDIEKEGFVRARVDGVIYSLEEVPELAAQKRHEIEAVIDRIVIRPGVESRLAESLRLALKLGSGVVSVSQQSPEQRAAGEWTDVIFNTKYGCPQCGLSAAEIEPRTFSFNSPYGACAGCDGLGVEDGFDPELVLPDPGQSLARGAVAPWRGMSSKAKQQRRAFLEPFLKANHLSAQLPLEEWPPSLVDKLLHGETNFAGILSLLDQEWESTRSDKMRQRLEEFRSHVVCVQCGGARLRAEALSCQLAGKNIAQISQMSIEEASQFFRELRVASRHEPIATPLLQEINSRLSFLLEVGANYLTLDRGADTLSGGEQQRVRLAAGIGSGLVGVLYLLDEPSVGLHPRDTEKLLQSLRRLQRQGNSVIVVEHDEEVMRAADHIIEIGPGAGQLGGQVVAEGNLEEFVRQQGSVTSDYLSGRKQIDVRPRKRQPKQAFSLKIAGARGNNLQNVDVEIPLGLFLCISGVSGSGKSTLALETLSKALRRKLHQATAKPAPCDSLRGTQHLDRVIEIDQSPIGRNARSNAATYSGVFDLVRKVFATTKEAKQRGFSASRFSFNVKGGRCEECQGQGIRKIEMSFLPNLEVGCPVCHGRRFNRQTLSIRYRDQTIADVLAMTVAEGEEFFVNHPAIHRLLTSLREVGLGYLHLGQPSTTLSGGEAQRVKLATELGRGQAGHTLYILDEPTTGLHSDDTRRLLNLLHELVEQGNSVLVIEHNVHVMQSADWLIDMGPEGGAAGGRILYSGPPQEIANCAESVTAACFT